MEKDINTLLQVVICLYLSERRISPKNSPKQQALGLEEGFLMTLQVYYDIAEEKRKLSQNHRPDLTKFRSTIFWDTKIENIDFAAHSRYVINRVFERGNEEEIQEVIHFYGRDVILGNINLNAKSPFENNIKANLKQYLDYEA